MTQGMDEKALEQLVIAWRPQAYGAKAKKSPGAGGKRTEHWKPFFAKDEALWSLFLESILTRSEPEEQHAYWQIVLCFSLLKKDKTGRFTINSKVRTIGVSR